MVLLLESTRLADVCKHALKTLHHTSTHALAPPRQQQPLLATADLDAHRPPLRSVLTLLHTLLSSAPASVRQSREFERTAVHLLRSAGGGASTAGRMSPQASDVLTVLLTVILKTIVDPSESSEVRVAETIWCHCAL